MRGKYMISFYYCDLESTGLINNYNEVTEISIIRGSDCMQLSRMIKCDYPERANADALRITNKTVADLSKGISKTRAVEDCNRFFNEDGLTPQHRCIIGHNIISFDKKFLFSLWEGVGKEFPATLWADTLQLTRAYAKQIGLIKPKVNLQAACDLLDVKKAAGLHNAKSDTRNAYLLWKALVEDKKMDYLPFIKTAAHILTPIDPDEEGGLDPSLLDD